MEYTKIKVASKDDPRRFYRVIAVAGDPGLYQLGLIIGKSIRCWFEHMFLFRVNRTVFWPDEACEEYEDEPMSLYNLSDLGNKFVFEYDTGEGYEFDCTVMKRKYYDNEDDDCGILAKVIEGSGQGIFENDHGTLWKVLNGTADLDRMLDDEDFEAPMNMEEFETLGDFYEPLDFDEMVYMENDIYSLSEQIFGEFEDFDEDEEDYEDEYDDIAAEELENTVRHMMECQLAYDIFYDDELNDVFTYLIRSHSMREAFELIRDIYINAMVEADAQGVKDPDELYSFCLKKIKSLVIKH